MSVQLHGIGRVAHQGIGPAMRIGLPHQGSFYPRDVCRGVSENHPFTLGQSPPANTQTGISKRDSPSARTANLDPTPKNRTANLDLVKPHPRRYVKAGGLALGC